MFPHTVTIYNVSQETDPATFKDVEKTYKIGRAHV